MKRNADALINRHAIESNLHVALKKCPLITQYRYIKFVKKIYAYTCNECLLQTGLMMIIVQ